MITIKGITNSDPGSGATPNISTDYRVNIEHTAPYIVKVEREALLDSHFEVRPMDIYVSKGKVKVKVMDESSTDPNSSLVWLRMEKGRTPANNDATYTGTTGVRKYFTTDLVTSTLQAISKEMEVASDTRIWLYFDENPNIFDKTYPNNDTYNKRYRDITVKLEYYDENGAHVASGDHEITFRQMNLWRLWSYNESDNNQKLEANKVRYYDIEYHEEYLNNYAADQGFGQTKDGMAWGLNGLELSDSKQSMKISGTGLDQIVGFITEGVRPFYDFYINSQESNGMENRPYGGKIFSIEIMEKILFDIDNNSSIVSDGLLTSDSKSAVEYCYHKNKRDNNGNIITKTGNNYNTGNVNWFLPSIDQIEEIVQAGYQDFEVFQEKWYWSSQPAYDRYTWYYDSWFGDDASGTLYRDDVSNGRATKVSIVGQDWKAEPSGSSSDMESNLVGSYSWSPWSALGNPGLTNNTKYTGDNPNNNSLDLGNQPRTNLNRIRCVRNTGTYSGN